MQLLYRLQLHTALCLVNRAYRNRPNTLLHLCSCVSSHLAFSEALSRLSCSPTTSGVGTKGLACMPRHVNCSKVRRFVTSVMAAAGTARSWYCSAESLDVEVIYRPSLLERWVSQTNTTNTK
jgi:hypothetical protein